MTLKHLGLVAALALTPAATFAETYNVTVVAGHPPVFRWVRMISESFIPTAQAELEAAGHSITFSEQYGGALAGVGEELEAVEAGLAEMGTCQALFDPAKLAVQNVTYYTPFVSDDVRLIADTTYRSFGPDSEERKPKRDPDRPSRGRAPGGVDDAKSRNRQHRDQARARPVQEPTEPRDPGLGPRRQSHRSSVPRLQCTEDDAQTQSQAPESLRTFVEPPGPREDKQRREDDKAGGGDETAAGPLRQDEDKRSHQEGEQTGHRTSSPPEPSGRSHRESCGGSGP